MGGAEGVHHEHVAQRRVLLGQLVGVLLFALVETHVFQQHQLARLDLDAAEIVAHQRHVTAQRFAQVSGDRCQAVLFAEHALFRTAQMRADHHGGALLQCQLDGGQGSNDTRIAGHLAVLDRHVEVFTNQYSLALEVQLAHGQYGHSPLLAW